MRVRKRMFQRRNSNYQVPEEERLLICLRKRRSFLSFEQCELWGRISRCKRERGRGGPYLRGCHTKECDV